MNNSLSNPVFTALTAGSRHLGFGTDKVKAFDLEVSPFAGFEEGYESGFIDLANLLPTGRHILFATPINIDIPGEWKLIEKVDGVQMIHTGHVLSQTKELDLKPLTTDHVPQMVELAHLTQPGPFGKRTIEFGKYHGIFDGDRLVAMSGQRMHLPAHIEVSAVCTHPDYLGRGYAATLVQHQSDLIFRQQKTPFLHVRADNIRAIEIYKRLGFEYNGTMRFYFLRKR